MSRGVWYRWQATEDATAIDPDFQTLALEWHDDLTAQDIRRAGLARDRHRPPQEAAIRDDRPQAYAEKIERHKAYLALCHACEAMTLTADQQLEAFHQLRKLGL